MNTLLSPLLRHGAWIAALLCAGAAIGYAPLLDGYEHALHPLALLGAKGVPRAAGFNLLAFVAPGLLVAGLAWRLRTWLSDSARWSARVGAEALLLSAIAFAAQGVLPLDPEELDGRASRLHAAEWMLWWIAFAVGGVLLAVGLRGKTAQRRLSAITQFAAVAVPVFALFVPSLLAAGIAQRIAFALWFAWAIAVGYAVSRSAASATGSSPTTRK